MKAVRQVFRDVLLIEIDSDRDDRGFIYTRYQEDDFNEIKIDGIFVEEKLYKAVNKASMYGIYYQEDPYQQNKIIYCNRGSAIIYVIDLDKNSATYKEWMCVEVSESSQKQVFIPKTYGYAFLTIVPDTEVVVKVDEYTTDGYSRTITYLDKNIDLEFPFEEVISDYKDKGAPTLKD